MVKIDKDIKKRWLTFALVTFVLIVLLFGAIFARIDIAYIRERYFFIYSPFFARRL